jgi:hypothetical protein
MPLRVLTFNLLWKALMKTLVRFGAVVLATAVLGVGCSARRAHVRHNDEKFAGSSSPSRLVVQINNVTDENKSRRNHVELFLDGKKIEPSRTAEGGQREYLYELSLPSGVHKIHGTYRAKSFWKDKEFKLATHDGRVRLYPGYTTFLTMALEKKSDGSLLRDKVFFTETPRAVRTKAAPQIAQTTTTERKIIEAPRAVFVEKKAEAQDEQNTAERPIIVVPAAPQNVVAPQISEPATSSSAIQTAASERVTPVVSLDRVAVPNEPIETKPATATLSQTETATTIMTVERATPIETAPQISAAPISRVEDSAAFATGKIALQINTTPANADVIVDDKYLGQSPLVTHVERGRSHVIQISKKGYADKIKLLERSAFGNQATYFLIEKLEKEE